MSIISKEEVKHIAKLARLELTEKETEKIQKDISVILDYFNLLKKVPKLAKGKQGSRTRNGGNATRKDEVMTTNSSLARKIIEAFPNKKDDYIKVKNIL